MAKPVLSTPVGIAPEVLTPGETGLMCSSADTAALTDGLRQMLAIRSRWRDLGLAARRRAEGFTAQTMARRYEELYVRWVSATRRAVA